MTVAEDGVTTASSTGGAHPHRTICWVVSLPRIPVTTRMFTFLGLSIDPYLPLLLGRRGQPNKYLNIFPGLPNYTYDNED